MHKNPNPTATEPPQPVSRCLQAASNWSDTTISGPAREIETDGRRGLNALSAHTVITLPHPGHTLNQTRGSLTFWLLPLEDYGYFFEPAHLPAHEPDYALHPILTDSTPLRQAEKANFFIMGRNFWFRQILYKFNRTDPDDAFANCHGQRASHGPDDLHLKAEQWYQLGLSWDHDGQSYALYVNGIRVCDGDSRVPQIIDKANEVLHTGCPLFAMGELNFYDQLLDRTAFRTIYEREATRIDAKTMQQLQDRYDPKELPVFDWNIDASYKSALDLTLTEPEHLDQFYVQGCTEGVRISKEGLHVETPTPDKPPYHFFGDKEKAATSQVFLHTWETFEGDIAFEVDFMSRAPEGLAFAMIHSSGMQREDYMKDYPLRTTGAMDMAYRENVRNYHWEFFRIHDGVRKDRTTSLFFKNPRLCARSYQVLPDLLPNDTWHTLRLIQNGRHFRGAINDRMVCEFTENPHDRSGGTYTFGHFSLRVMFKSAFLFRNLKIHVRPPAFKSWPLEGEGQPQTH